MVSTAGDVLKSEVSISSCRGETPPGYGQGLMATE